MEDKQFKVGDVVFLNSGSPQLTITSISNDQKTVDVTFWNDVVNEFSDRTFLSAVISLVQYSEVL